MSERELGSLFLLSIVVPVGLVASFGLVGVFKEPIEVIVADPVAWQTERPALGPDQSFSINQSVQNVYIDDQISVTFSIRVLHYYEDYSRIPYGQIHKDGLDFRVNSGTNATQGGVDTVLVKFQLLNSNAAVWVSTVEHLETHNVNITMTKYFGTDTAYVEAQALGAQSSLKTHVDWVFSDENTQSHRSRVTSEVLHFNGKVWRNIVVPLVLEVTLPSWLVSP